MQCCQRTKLRKAILTVLLPLQFPANGSGKAVRDGPTATQVLGPLTPKWESWKKLLALTFPSLIIVATWDMIQWDLSKFPSYCDSFKWGREVNREN